MIKKKHLGVVVRFVPDIKNLQLHEHSCCEFMQQYHRKDAEGCKNQRRPARCDRELRRFYRDTAPRSLIRHSLWTCCGCCHFSRMLVAWACVLNPAAGWLTCWLPGLLCSLVGLFCWLDCSAGWLCFAGWRHQRRSTQCTPEGTDRGHATRKTSDA